MPLMHFKHNKYIHFFAIITENQNQYFLVAK
ncbi:Uncharacterised protein [Sphingobacterium daejeonense]|nr:Uncharacterised protein [Sphingobacterium daejeonense]